jgi:hypothetical protein
MAEPARFSALLELELMSAAADDYQFDVSLRAARCNRIDQHIGRFVKLG